MASAICPQAADASSITARYLGARSNAAINRINFDKKAEDKPKEQSPNTYEVLLLKFEQAI